MDLKFLVIPFEREHLFRALSKSVHAFAERVFTMLRNRCSRFCGMSVHFCRNMQKSTASTQKGGGVKDNGIRLVEEACYNRPGL